MMVIAVSVFVALFGLAGRQLFLMPLVTAAFVGPVVIAMSLSEGLLMMLAIVVGAVITVAVMISVSISIMVAVTIMIAPCGSALVIVSPFVMIGGSGQRRCAQPEHQR